MANSRQSFLDIYGEAYRIASFTLDIAKEREQGRVPLLAEEADERGAFVVQAREISCGDAAAGSSQGEIKSAWPRFKKRLKRLVTFSYKPCSF